MSQTGLGVLLAVIFFVIPGGFFAWLALTGRGRERWSRAARASQQRFERPPSDPLDNPAVRWLVLHPWRTAAIAAVIEVLLARTAGWDALGAMVQVAGYWALFRFHWVPRLTAQSERFRAG